MSYLYSNYGLNGYILIRNIRIENANAISGPLSYGFPALSGFVGAIHALSRDLSQLEDFSQIRLDGCLVACKDLRLHTYQDKSYSPYTFIQKRNPILKDGSTAAIIEEGRCHLTVHLIIGVYGELPPFLEEGLTQFIQQNIFQHRIAGGSVMALDKKSAVTYIPSGEIDNIKNSLLPAFVLMSAHDQLAAITEELRSVNPQSTPLDALIETSVLHHIPQDDGSWDIQSIKQGRGWLVPIPVGYQGISSLIEAGDLVNSRNPEYPAQYVETIYSLGKWVFPTAIDELHKAIWFQCYDPHQHLYLIQQS